MALKPLGLALLEVDDKKKVGRVSSYPLPFTLGILPFVFIKQGTEREPLFHPYQSDTRTSAGRHCDATRARITRREEIDSAPLSECS
ncbi:hypothetical protein TNCT_381341 [Trichonephila clavata]|uniref:Uncharacterized protein n=1 Tax=Trichonephila clavata TaxID=2740835 RepID=A0A8X6IZ45_TRICU|nr:hypothetical protein TNCT_381341 [Trichonephila clavata]